MKLFKRFIPLALICIMLVLTACVVKADVAAVISPTPTATATPTATPIPTPTVPPLPHVDEVLDTFCNCLYSVPVFYDYREDLVACKLPETPAFSNILAAKESLFAMSGEWYAAFAESVEEAISQTEDRHPEIVLTYEAELGRMDWRYLGSFVWALSESFNPWELLEVTAEVTSSETGLYHLSVSLQPTAHTTLIRSIARQDRDLYMNSRYIYSYLMTVFDENGEEIVYEQPMLDEAFVSSIHMPLTACDFFDRWYQARSNNTRKHTGLDMRAPADSEIVSCTDGTVLCVGYQDIPGYYVVVLDDAGYEWHYYHMIRQSDFLEEGQRVHAGDLIGHVGNTGNSAVNHLHLALITPQGVFVRLYDIMNAYYSIN